MAKSKTVKQSGSGKGVKDVKPPIAPAGGKKGK